MTATEMDWGKIILWIVIWVIGYVLGLVEGAVKRKNKEKKSEEEIKLLKEEIENFQPVEEISEPTSLSVFEKESGALRLRLDGEMVEDESDLNVEQRKRLLSLVLSLRPWLATKESVEPIAPPPVKAKTPPAPAPVRSNPKVDLNEPVRENDYSNLSMVEQIDRILQKKLVGSPLKERNIRLRTSLSGGLLIQVGLEKYEWIDKIPDKAIQDIIREASTEWENNATRR